MDVGIRKMPATRPIATIGMFTRKTEPHQKCSSSKPPVIGPSPMPSAETPAHTPIALPRSFAVGEDVRDDRERRRHDERPADAIERRVAMSWPGGRQRRRNEPTRTRQSPTCSAPPAEAVAQAPGGEQQAREDQRVRVDHPLQLAVGRVELARERRDRDVEDRVVEHDHEQAEAQDEKDQPAPVVMRAQLAPSLGERLMIAALSPLRTRARPRATLELTRRSR